MRILWAFLLTFFLSWSAWAAAPVSVSDLTADTAPEGEDLLVVTINPSTTPASRKVTLTNAIDARVGWMNTTGKTYLYSLSNNVGIGTSVPVATLEVQKYSTYPPLMISSAATLDGDYFVVTNAGNVGVGSANPQASFVIGNGGSPTYPSITNANDAFIRGDVEIDGNLYVDGLIYGNQLIMPYGEYSSNISQVVGATTLSYATTFDSNDIQQNMTHAANDSKIYINEAGTYLITFSAVGKSTVANKSLDIWLSVNGVNVPASNTLSKFVGSGNERIITVTYIYKFTAGQYFELMYHGDDTGVSLTYAAAASTPTRPASPSIILTVNKISR